MKVIFLDFDGVLNSERFFRLNGSEGLALDPACMIRLREIVSVTDAVIVLSTSWREHWEKNADECSAIGLEINEIFEKYNMRIYDKTPFSEVDRETDIETWLEEHSETTDFVVLDDRFLDSELIRGHFVKTDGALRGLDEWAQEESIAILLKNT